MNTHSFDTFVTGCNFSSTKTDNNKNQIEKELVDKLVNKFSIDEREHVCSIMGSEGAEYELPSLAASAAMHNIINFVEDWYPSDSSLQYNALYHYLKQFTFGGSTEDVVLSLRQIASNSKLMAASICREWDQIKCFLRLLSSVGVPAYVTDVAIDDPDYSVTEIVFKKFTVKKTYFEDYEQLSYKINLDYHALCILLSGDVETNPGPTVLSKDATISKLQRELEKKKLAEKKQRSCIQRAIELEKRRRKRNRELLAGEKRYAQGVGDAVASCVEGAKTVAGGVSTIAKQVISDTKEVLSDPESLTETAKAASYVGLNVVAPGVGTAIGAAVNAPKVTAAANRLNPTIDMLQGILQTVTDSLNDLRGAFSLPADCDLIGIIVSISSICYFLKEKQFFLLTIHCGNLARQLGISLSSLMSLMPTISQDDISYTAPAGSETVDPGEGPSTAPVGQSLVSDLWDRTKSAAELIPVNTFIAFFCGIFSKMCSGSLPSPIEMVKHFSLVGRASQGFRAIKDMFVWLYEYVAGIYYDKVYGLSYEQYQFMKNFPQLEDLYAAVTIIEKFDKALIDKSAPIADEILAVNLKLRDHHTQATKVRSTQCVQLVDSMLKRINKHIDWAVRSSARTQIVRNEPIALYLYGQPGVGKSIATEVLTAMIYQEYLAKKGLQYANCSYLRRATNEFWEGYHGQPVVVMDDFGNRKDSMQNPVTEYEEFEWMINTASYPLKMAELSAKGCVNFSSEFVIASSNQKHPDIKSLVDPGAVYRRMHICAEVTIDPNYGLPRGKDSNGDTYFQFHLPTACAYLQKDEDEINPLMTEHYRFNLYTVSFNKQTGKTEETHLPGKSNLSFDEFWEFFKTENERRSKINVRLSDAIRQKAGLAANDTHETEAEVMKKFDKIFRPETFVETVAATEDVDLGVTVPPQFVDAQVDSTFGSMAEFVVAKLRLDKVKQMFESARSACHSAFVNLWSLVGQGITKATGTLLSVAEFLLSCLSSFASKTIEYLPAPTVPKVLATACGTIAAFLAVWASGIFKRTSTTDTSLWCPFNRSPTAAQAPCKTCSSCKILQYPESGEMLSHYLDRVGMLSIRKDLYALGMDRDELDEVRERVRVSQNNARAETIAQKLYNPEPRVPGKGPHAQGFREHGIVECQTETHIGSRVYAQRDRVRIEQTTQVLLHNAVWIEAVDARGRCSRSNGVFLVGRTLVTTAHTIITTPHEDPIVSIVIRNPYSTAPVVTVPFKDCAVSQAMQLDGSPVDLALISFPPVVPSRPRILSKFLDAEAINKLSEGTLVFSGFYEVKGKTVVQEKHPGSFAVSTKATSYFRHTPGTCPVSTDNCPCAITIGNHISYDLETQNGMCGALLSVSNRLVHTKLVGFHVAGGVGVEALGVLTTKQFLEANLQAHITKFNIPQQYLLDGRLPYSQSYVDTEVRVSLVDEGDCISVGSAPAPASPVETQLARSLVHGKVQEPITKPAHLRAALIEGEGMVDPMMKGIKKVLGPQSYVDKNLLEAAANDVFQGLGPPPSGKGVIHTYEEAIVGVEGDPLKRPINRTTSPGYPYNLTNKAKGKTAWLGSDEEYITDNAELRADVKSLLDAAKEGARGNAISIATLKDEKRPIAKVDAGKTRVFEACPQHLVIAMRQYFLDFAAHVMRNRIKNGIAVGINPYSLEWTNLAHHLQSKGNYMIAGDFSNFDGSLIMQVLVKIVEKINQWYGDDEESKLIRMALWEHICNADILVKGEVIRKTHSQPSGNPLTVIINSLFNGIIMRIAYMMMKQKRGLPATCDYRKHVAEIIYGDDDIKSVSAEIVGWFNQVELTKALAEIGLTYTDETKTGQILPFKPLEEVAFLKRKFVIQPDGTFFAPMDLPNILEITNWIRGKALRTATLENCEQAISELALHSQEVYEHWSARIREELAKVKINIHVPTYYEQMEEYRSKRDLYERLEYVPLW